MSVNPWLIGGGVVGAVALGGAAYTYPDWFLRSAKAAELGISNEPTTEWQKANLAWLAKREAKLTPFLREYDGNVYVASVFRNDEVNAAVGGVTSSKHRRGLAIDYGGTSSYEQFGRWVKANLNTLGDSVKPELCYVEVHRNHLHFEWYDPTTEANLQETPTKYRIWTPENASKVF